MIRAAFLIGITLASCLPARASTNELESAVFRSIVFGSTLYSVEQRRTLGAALTAYWSHFRGRIPRLSPREQDWAKGELGAPDLDRVNKFMATREGGLYMAYDQVARCHGAATSVVAAIGTNKTDEALAWLSMLRCYRYAGDIRVYLHRGGLIAQPRDDLEFKMEAAGVIQTALIGMVESVLLSAS